MARRRQIRLVHRFVRLHFAENADVLVVIEQRIDRVENALRSGDRIFGFTDVRSFASQPENDIAGSEHVGDVHGTLGAIDRILSVVCRVGCVTAVDRMRIFPQTRGDEFGEQPFVGQEFFDFRNAVAGLVHRPFGRNYVVIVKLHAIEAELFVFAQLDRKVDIWTNRWTKRVCPG